MKPELKQVFVQYVNENLRPNTVNPAGNRCPVLFLRGENAVETLKKRGVIADYTLTLNAQRNGLIFGGTRSLTRAGSFALLCDPTRAE